MLQIAKTRILKALTRLGAVEVRPDALAVDDAWAARDPVLAHLAAAAVAGLPPAGPAERKRDPVTIVDGARPEIVGDLVVQDQGFNLHAKTHAGATDEPARPRLLRYVLRPPLARERLSRLPDHRVRLQLKRPWSELPSNSRWRPLVIPPPPEQSTASTDEKAEPKKPSAAASAPISHPPAPSRSGTRCRYIKWAQLIRLTFGLDVEHCPACGGQMKLRALVLDPASIERFLRHQGLWSQPHEPAPARAPPYHRSVTRLHPSRQEALGFDT